MYIKDIVRIVQGTPTNLSNLNKKINKIKLNSKEITINDVFICIGKGINYIEEAIDNGCILIITDQIIRLKTNICIIKVDDIHNCLINIIKYIRNKYKYIPLIAITGSVGKTTTKELISNILSTELKVLKNFGNKNNYIGITETLLNIDNTYDVIVLELGMNHKGEIDELSKSLKPDIALITNIGTSHIGNLGSKMNILKAKQEILNGLNKGYLIIPSNDHYLNKIKYPFIIKNNIKPTKIKLTDKLSFTLKYYNKKYNIIFNIPNKNYINNILLAFQVSILFNIDILKIVKEINNYKPLDKRMNIINLDNYTIIDDTYNSSYESLKSVLDYLKTINQSKILILGDIKELGIYSKDIHLKINNLLNKIPNKQVLLVGEEVKVIHGLHFSTNKELIEYLSNIDIKSTIILLKGSRIMKLEEIKDYLLKKRK